MAEGTRCMFSQEFTPEELVSWLEQRQSDINFQPIKDAGIDGKGFILADSGIFHSLQYTLREQLKIREVQVSLVKCYMVKAKIANVKTHKGYRAAVYKMAQQHSGLYNPWDKTQTIHYRSDGDNLHIALLFEEKSSAATFHTALSQWHLDNPLLALANTVSVDRLLVEMYVEKSELNPVLLSDYVGADTESPVQSLETFQGLPCSNISVVSQGDPLAVFQSIEKAECFRSCKAYKMHLKSQSKYPDIAGDSNNMLVGSWTPLHQLFDGLNTIEEVPMVAIKPLVDVDFEEINVGIPPQKRYKVHLEIEFCDENSALEMENRFKDGSSKMSPTKWRSFVHVTNPVRFCTFLKFKYRATMITWKKFND